MKFILFAILLTTLNSHLCALEQERKRHTSEVPLLSQHPEVIKRLDQILQQLETIKDTGIQSLQELKNQSHQIDSISQKTTEIQAETTKATKNVQKIEKIVSPGCILF
jgi:uncharacterized protein (UPF0305 family)